MAIIEDINQQRRLDLATCNFIMSKKELISTKMQIAVSGFKNTLMNRVSLTEKQHTYLDGIYETVMGKLTGEKVNLHIDLKNKSKQNLKY